MCRVSSLFADSTGLKGNVKCHRLRQVLILNKKTIKTFSLQPGDLRENVVVDCDSLYELPSGTELRVGTMRVRLTFHCEPCKKVAHLVAPNRLVHCRGYLGAIENAGEVKVGDSIVDLGKRFDEIPYNTFERVKWFLDNHPGQVAASELTSAIALRNSYCRVLPRYLKRLGSKYTGRVIFKNEIRSNSK